jgi:four helix bundle protein
VKKPATSTAEQAEFRLDEITAYRISFKLSNYLWEIVSRWESLERKSVGAQFMNAVDSISAHIARGFGGTDKKDKINHFRISYGYMYEAIDWNQKAKVRKLLEDKEYKYIYKNLHELPKSIQALIDYTEKSMKD